MEGWETGVGMEYAGNEDFRDCSFVGFYIKSLKICRICCCAMTGYWL